jgi:hypothetical protein
MNYTTPGARLPNGAIVVAARLTHRAGPITNPEAVVLALTNGMAGHPYVTWSMNPEDGQVYAGDYCLTFEGAMRSYAARSGFLVEALGNGTAPAEDRAKNVTPRKTRDLCQACWQEYNPAEYAPVMNRDGECARCGDIALVIRTAYADSPADDEERR